MNRLPVCSHCDGEHAPADPCTCATCGLPSHDLAVVNVCNDGGLWLECRECRFSDRTVAAPIVFALALSSASGAGKVAA